MNIETQDEHFMREAILEAEKALALDEVPIGCVIVSCSEIIARGHNRRNTDHSSIAHAEITAIAAACFRLGDWRLEGCTIYVTVEPCPMCAGAILTARMDRVVFGASNPKAGCCGSILNLLDNKAFNHQAEITKGVLGSECQALMSGFFKRLR